MVPNISGIKNSVFVNASLILEYTLVFEVYKIKERFSELWATFKNLLYISVCDYVVIFK